MLTSIFSLAMLISTSSLPYLLAWFLFCVFWYNWLSSTRNKTKTSPKNLPPSPKRLPIIGNLHQLGLYPHISLQALSNKHGPLMLLHLGNVPTLVVSSAAGARETMKTQDLTFSSRPKSSISGTLFYDGKDIGFAPYSDYWKRLKSICVLQLLNSKKVLSFKKVREEEVALLVDNIRQHSRSSTVVNLSEMFVQLTFDVLCRAALGRKYESFEGGGENTLKEILGSALELVGVFSFADHIPWLSWVDHITGLNAKCKRVAKRLDEFMEDVMNDHILEAGQKKDEADAGRLDFVHVLLENQKQNRPGFDLDRVAIKALVYDMFVAGTDTTSVVLEWTMAQLLKHPKVMAKLYDEVREIGKDKSCISEEDLEKMHYLKAVIKETLRLNCPLPFLIPRESREDAKVMGYDIAAETKVLINVWAIARDPSFWDKPEEFLPERFLNSPIDHKGLYFEFTPFGSGRRGCPGIQFGMSLDELALANLVHSFEFALPGGERLEDLDMTGTFGITVHKKHPLLLVATPR